MTGRPTVAVGLALALAGCGRKPQPRVTVAEDAAIDAPASQPRPTTAVIDTVRVELHGRVETVIDPRALGRSLARCLLESGAPVVALDEQVPVGQVGRHLELTIVLTTHEPTAERTQLAVTVDLGGRWVDDPLGPGPVVSLTGVATPVAAGPGAGSKIAPADAAAAVVVLELEPQLCRELTDRLATWAADDLGPALDSGDPAAVRWALVVAAGREPSGDDVARLRLITAIARHLGDEPTIRDAAIGAMIATRDAHAVAPLTAITNLGDAASLIRIIEAVARLGGDDARDYLQVLTSHRDRAVARAAEVGLATVAANR